ncbi:MAG: hypothetical protein AAFV80_21285 [Bacteroidota bacterium]
MSASTYKVLSDYHFSWLHFRGILGSVGLFVLQPSREHRIARLDFRRKMDYSFLRIEAKAVRLQLEYFKSSGRFEVWQGDQLLYRIPQSKELVTWRIGGSSYKGLITQDLYFKWFPDQPRSSANIIASPFIKGESNVFNFIVNDNELKDRENWIMLGIAFILLSAENLEYGRGTN